MDDSRRILAVVLSSLVVSAVQAQMLVYEPFDDSNPTLSGNTPGIGLTGTWAGNGDVASGSYTYHELLTSGNQANKPSSGSMAAGVSLGTALSSAGLLDNGATLFFSLLLHNGPGNINMQGAFALGTDQLSGGNNHQLPMSNSGNGIGLFTSRNSRLYARTWLSGTGDTSATYTGVSTGTTYLVVGRIRWGATGGDTDTVDLYLPDSNLVQGAIIETMTNTFDQTAFDTVTFSCKSADQIGFDEIRFGASYNDVVRKIPRSGYMFLVR